MTLDKYTRTIVRMDYPELPAVSLPWYPRSAGRECVMPGQRVSRQSIQALELLWLTAGTLRLKFAGMPHEVIMNAGDSIFRLPGNHRLNFNPGSQKCLYRWLCIDGPGAEKFITDYGLPLHAAIHSGQCPEEVFDEMEALLLANSTYAMRKMISVITDIIARMIPETEASDTDRLLSAALSLIGRNYQYSQFNINVLADALNVHRTTLGRLFREKLSKSPHEYLHDLRLRQALMLLHDSDMPVNEIARVCGFSQCNYFCRMFMRQYGRTPGASRIAGR